MSDRRENLEDFFDEVINGDDCSASILDSILDCNQRYTDFNFYEEGGSKAIFKAQDQMTQRQVAFAKLKGSATKGQTENFLREARINALLQHPNIVPVYDIGINEDEPFFAMKFVHGRTLADIIRSLRKNESSTSAEYSRTELIDIFLKICDATSYAHSNGVLHLDLKPENIRIDNFGDVQLCDWGLARLIDGSDKITDEFGSLEQYSINQEDMNKLTVDGYIKGTPGYMAPEQAGSTQGRKGIPTDVYSLGVILYYILSYKEAFRGDINAIIAKTLEGDFCKPSVHRENIPKALESICLKAMSLRAVDRYNSVSTMKDDILSYRNGYLTSAEEKGLWKVFSLFIKRNIAVSFSLLASLFLILILSFAHIDSLKNERDKANKALALAQEEKEKRQYLSDLGVDFFIKQAKQMVVFHSFEEAEKVIEQIPESEFTEAQKIQVRDLFGRVAFYRQQYKKSLDLLEGTKERDNKFLRMMARKYAKRKSSDEVLLKGDDFVELLGELEAFNIQHTWSSYEYEILHYSDIYEHIKAVEKMIHVKNNSVENLNIKLTEKEGKYFLDLSNNPDVHSVVGIRSMPLTGLNLSGSGIKDFRMAILKDLPLEDLDVSDCRLSDYGFLKHYKKLKKITVNAKEAQHPSFLKYAKGLEVITRE